MKKVYTVSGSQDGTIGNYSSKKKAMASAKAYVEQSDKVLNIYCNSPNYNSVGAYRARIVGNSSSATVQEWSVE